MSLRDLRDVAGRAIALLATGLVVVILGLAVVLPKLGGATAYTILTGSMRPGMPPGTLVVVKPVHPDQIRVGDVLTYQLRSGDPTVATHRVVGVGTTLGGEPRFTLQGDANNAPDPTVVRPEQIKGKRWYSVPYLAYPSLVVGGNIRQYVVMGAVVLLLAYALFSFVGAARDRANRRHRIATDSAERQFEEVGS
jgi:signal peptidase